MHRTPANTDDKELDAQVHRISGIGQRDHEYRTKHSEDVLHIRPEEERGGFDSRLQVVFAILASIDRIVENGPAGMWKSTEIAKY